MPPTFKLDEKAAVLAHHLGKLKPGEILSYEDMGKAIGESITGAHPSYQRAKYRLLREQVVIETVPGKGAVRVPNEGTVAVGERHLRRSYRAARRSLQTLAACDPAKLDEEGRREYMLQSTRAGMAVAIAGSKGRKAVEKHAERDTVSLRGMLDRIGLEG
jgi:hypothetical protein